MRLFIAFISQRTQQIFKLHLLDKNMASCLIIMDQLLYEILMHRVLKYMLFIRTIDGCYNFGSNKVFHIGHSLPSIPRSISNRGSSLVLWSSWNSSGVLIRSLWAFCGLLSLIYSFRELVCYWKVLVAYHAFQKLKAVILERNSLSIQLVP